MSMRSSRPHARFAPLAVALAGLAAAPAPAKVPAPVPQTYTFDAASSRIDYKAQTGVFKNIKISQGKVTVYAQQATAVGIGEPDGLWTLIGAVRVHASPHSSLSAAKAVVQVRNQRIGEVTVTGTPALFRERAKNPHDDAEGHADRIVYDVMADTVELIHDAWLSNGRNQIRSPQIRYNIRADRIEAASAGPGKRVHISIAPRIVSVHKARAAAKPSVRARPAHGPAGPPR